jgi:hypothetical protein
MALILKDRVKVSTTTTGTGTLSLGAAEQGFQDFSSIGNGNTTYYTITNGADWEVGIGTYSSTGDTLTRDTVLDSSAGGAKVDFPAGAKEVFVVYPAAKQISDGSNISQLTNDAGFTTNTGTVTSVDLTAGTGISVSGGPITGSGAITVTNTAPDQTVTLTQGANVTITGTYPSFTIAASDTTYSAGTGLNLSGTTFSIDSTVTTLTGTQTLTNKTIEKAVLNDGYTEEVFAITDGTTVNLDPNNGSIQTWTLGANRTPGQANWAAGQSITLMVDDGTARTITWTTLAVVWTTDGGSAPTLNTSGFTTITLWKVGTTIYGARVGDA